MAGIGLSGLKQWLDSNTESPPNEHVWEKCLHQAQIYARNDAVQKVMWIHGKFDIPVHEAAKWELRRVIKMLYKEKAKAKAVKAGAHPHPKASTASSSSTHPKLVKAHPPAPKVPWSKKYDATDIHPTDAIVKEVVREITIYVD